MIWIGYVITGWLVAGAIGFFIAALFALSCRNDECARCRYLRLYHNAIMSEKDVPYLSDFAKGPAAKRAGN